MQAGLLPRAQVRARRERGRTEPLDQADDGVVEARPEDSNL
jgi:hypothetical protein